MGSAVSDGTQREKPVVASLPMKIKQELSDLLGERILADVILCGEIGLGAVISSCLFPVAFSRETLICAHIENPFPTSRARKYRQVGDFFLAVQPKDRLAIECRVYLVSVWWRAGFGILRTVLVRPRKESRTNQI